ncbi:hypothetical protein EDD22DRAFT_844478 [Suillus occidentalis]|nr:hypothetical protein EDD22DRAFT_844478 [Suillus occidentalis]
MPIQSRRAQILQDIDQSALALARVWAESIQKIGVIIKGMGGTKRLGGGRIADTEENAEQEHTREQVEEMTEVEQQSFKKVEQHAAVSWVGAEMLDHSLGSIRSCIWVGGATISSSSNFSASSTSNGSLGGFYGSHALVHTPARIKDKDNNNTIVKDKGNKYLRKTHKSSKVKASQNKPKKNAQIKESQGESEQGFVISPGITPDKINATQDEDQDKDKQTEYQDYDEEKKTKQAKDKDKKHNYDKKSDTIDYDKQQYDREDKDKKRNSQDYDNVPYDNI